MKNLYFFFLLLVLACSSENTEELVQIVPDNTATYFPPLNATTWETKTISQLNWDENNLQSLLTFLNEKNTKSFMILHKGKIVVENYFNDHTENTLWYWASAGKTLTTATIGIAQDEGLININNKVSDYLGTGWTDASLQKENLILCKNLLNMTSGLDDSLGDSTSPENLQYVADAGDRWAYHNVFLKLQDIVSETSNQTWSNYFNIKLRDRIGMSGSWYTLGDLNVYWSNTRSMARFGLLISNHGKWEDTQIISENYINETTTTSQEINEAYGYLWWLNGNNTYHLPQSQFEFNGALIPNAPDDMFAALGKNDQKIYVVPSKELVIIRMGAAADDSNFALSNFDNELWEKINLLID